MHLEHVYFPRKKKLGMIDKIKVSKTPGPDNISPRVLKEAKDELIKPLSIVQEIIDTRQNSDWCKLANVALIFNSRR